MHQPDGITVSRQLPMQLDTAPELPQALGPQALLLPRFAAADADELVAAVRRLSAVSPFRHLVTPGGFAMSVGLTNCGALGWTTDRRGYRYAGIDPETGQPWPAMPTVFLRLAQTAARAAGYDRFEPDACLVNRYLPGARLSLHQDRNERDFTQPIVSVSLGMRATFLFGGLQRAVKPAKIPLQHGDVLVWGGSDRLRYHGIMPLKDEPHPTLGGQRINLTLRKAG